MKLKYFKKTIYLCCDLKLKKYLYWRKKKPQQLSTSDSTQNFYSSQVCLRSPFLLLTKVQMSLLLWLSSTHSYFITEYKNANHRLFLKVERNDYDLNPDFLFLPAYLLPIFCPLISLLNNLSQHQCWLSIPIFLFLLRTISSQSYTPFSVVAHSIPLYPCKSFHSALSGKGNLYLEY